MIIKLGLNNLKISSSSTAKKQHHHNHQHQLTHISILWDRILKLVNLNAWFTDSHFDVDFISRWSYINYMYAVECSYLYMPTIKLVRISTINHCHCFYLVVIATTKYVIKLKCTKIKRFKFCIFQSINFINPLDYKKKLKRDDCNTSNDS